MVDNHLIKCEDCKHEFEKGEWISECPNCEEVYCEGCWKNHNCLEEEYDRLELDCTKCGAIMDSEEIRQCPYCSDNFCSDCWQTHSKSHLDEDVKPTEYLEFVEKKFMEEL